MSTRTPTARERLAVRRDPVRVVRDATKRRATPAAHDVEALERLGSFVRSFGISSRELLKASAASVGLSLIAVDVFSKSAEAKTLTTLSPTLTINTLRRDDMLALRFDLYNLMRDKQTLV